jgi:hypothetical protein
VVVGYNDTESLPKSFAASGGAASILGYSVSSNKGVSFSDMGYPTLSSDPSSFLGVDQVMTCSSAQNFYFSSLNFTATRAGVSVSASVDGGRTFGQPVVVASASLSGHIFDGDWMAVNPANPNQLFVTYTDDDVTFTVCPTALGTSIELVNSNDGGNTWSSPQTVAGEVCLDPSSATPGAVEFSGIAIDPLGAGVYVTWENLVPKSLARGINISSAAIPATPSPTPFGLSFSNAVKISSVNYAGTLDTPESGAIGAITALFQGLQGRIFTLEHPELAIGKGPKNTGVLYVTWSDGANAVADAQSKNGTYQFTDVLLASSTDGGHSWSKPVRVNSDVEDGVTHPFTDQFHPTVATDNTGAIAVCFYDRRNDPLNFLIGRYCATSTDGKTWSNFAIDPKGGPSIVNQDDAGVSDWLGDYETLATDSLNKSGGFVGGYTNTSAGYQNIRENKFSSEEE